MPDFHGITPHQACIEALRTFAPVRNPLRLRHCRPAICYDLALSSCQPVPAIRSAHSQDRYWAHYDDWDFNRWLLRMNVHDARVTQLPSDWDDIALKIALNARDSRCRPFCVGCGRNIANHDLLLERGGGFKGDMVTCASDLN